MWLISVSHAWASLDISLFRVQGNYEEADALRVRVIEIEEKELGSDNPNLSRTLNNRARSLQARVSHIAF